MKIEINPRWCKGCYICISVCPKDVFAKSETLTDRGFYGVDIRHLENCIACLQCEYSCPDLAINVIADKKEK